jgi:glycosyltransferase involved in cell wall biosynthesis
MTMKKKLFIINTAQFGYRLITYKVAEHLKDDFSITYIGFDTGKEKTLNKKISVYDIEKIGNNRLIQNYHFLEAIIRLLRKQKPDYIFIGYNHDWYFFLIKLFYWKAVYIFDIRTGSQKKSILFRKIDNFFLKFNSKIFGNVTIISSNLAKKLKIQNAHHLPNGGYSISKKRKEFNTLKLLYVGTLVDRNIHETIIGFYKFKKKYNLQNLEYHIIGKSTKEYENTNIERTIKQLQLEEEVFFHGYKKRSELKPYFDLCNVGVGYLPIYDYYNYQPLTKIYEYGLSGLVTIATNTTENQILINSQTGVLCQDNADSFALALERLYKKRSEFSSQNIIDFFEKYQWKNIMEYNLKEYIKRLG